MTLPAVAILGDINIDFTLHVDAYPPEGGEGIATREIQNIGGSATNTAMFLAKLGMPVRFIGKVGQDAWGERCLADMATAGIDTRRVCRTSEEPTQVNVVVVSRSGERTMFAYRGANTRLNAREIDAGTFEAVALLHLSGYALLQAPQRDAAIRALDLARARNIPATLDVPSGVVTAIRSPLDNLLLHLETLFLSEADLLALSGEATIEAAANALLSKGVRNLVVKAGERGAFLWNDEGRRHAPAMPAEVIDTTGAGDAFAAGYIYGTVRGLSAVSRLTLANAAGAVAVSNTGDVGTWASADALHAKLRSCGVDQAALREIDLPRKQKTT
ncbi:MAG: carbohydrate kinase family protein [Rhizobiaceae bacterium]